MYKVSAAIISLNTEEYMYASLLPTSLIIGNWKYVWPIKYTLYAIAVKQCYISVLELPFLEEHNGDYSVNK